MSVKKFIIGGVNEHFNFPWRDAIEKKLFLQNDINLIWKDIAGGTGEMTKLLSTGELDFAVILTEGLLAHSIREKDVTILQFHVKSSLPWGIHLRKEDSATHENELFKKRFAISRFNSGSHLMAKVLANKYDEKISDDQFIVTNSLEGGLIALQKKEADVFLWEKYTTAPFLEKYSLKSIGIVPTPWPSFCLAANNKVIAKAKDEILKIETIICNHSKEIKADPNSIELIAKRYSLDLVETKKWFKETEWNTQVGISENELDVVLKSLYTSGLISKEEADSSYIKSLLK